MRSHTSWYRLAVAPSALGTRRETGNVLLAMIALLTTTTITLGTAAVVYHQGLNDAFVEETFEELQGVSDAIGQYWQDVGSLPPDLDALIAPPDDVEGWMGPYIGEWFVDLAAAGIGPTQDAWGNPYIYEIAATNEANVRSMGINGIDDDGDGDDLTIVADIDANAWAVTRWEMRILNAAIAAYNFYPTNPTYLPNGWNAAIGKLQSHGFLPSGNDVKERFRYDEWGQEYEPQGNPITSVASSGAPGSGEGDDDDDD